MPVVVVIISVIVMPVTTMNMTVAGFMIVRMAAYLRGFTAKSASTVFAHNQDISTAAISSSRP